MSSGSIPNELRDILTKLYFISMIERGIKINTNKLGFVNAESWVGSILRALGHENRKTTLNFINSTIDQSINSIRTYKDTDYIDILINSLNSARGGITNLTSTYHDDPEFYSSIRVCLANIDIQLEKYKNLISGDKSDNN